MNKNWQSYVPSRALGLGLLIISTALVGCGGGGGGGSSDKSSSVNSQSSSSVATLSQVIGNTFVNVEGASVRLDGSNGDALAPVSQTQNNGQFSFSNLAESALNGAKVSVKNGYNASMALDFTGLTLQAPVINGTFTVSPLTTLISIYMADGADLTAAKAQLTNIWGESLGDPLVSGAGSPLAFKANVQLSLLAIGAKSSVTIADIAELVKSHGADWAAIERTLEGNSELSELQRQDIAATFDRILAVEAIDPALGTSDFVAEVNLINLSQGLTGFIANELAHVAADEALFAANITNFSRAILAANQSQGIAQHTSTYANLLRYVFNAYELTPADFDSAEWSIPTGLITDERIASLASSRVIDHRVALTDGETISSSETKRAYYYASDLAPAYRVQQLFRNVLDDNYSDEIYGRIAANLITRGMVSEADVILKTQIFSPYWVARGYVQAGEAFANLNDITRAKQYWDIAANTIEQHMRAVGIESMTSDEASVFQVLSKHYNNYEFLEASQNVLAPVNEFLAMQTEYTTAYGRLLVAYGSLTSEAVEAAEAGGLAPELKAQALDSLVFYESIVNATGIQKASSGCPEHYMLKASSITGLANHYALLKEPELTREKINQFNALRDGHACTATRTNVYIKNLVGAYAYLNDLDGYLTLIEQGMTVEATPAQIQAAKNAAYEYQAIELARGGDVSSAIALVSSDSPNDTIDELTNSGVSLSSVNSGLAIKLFEQGFKAEGAAVLEAAWNIAASNEFMQLNAANGTRYARYGCAKVAQHTFNFADQTLGLTRLANCQSLIDTYAAQANPMAAAEAYVYLSEAAMNIKDAATAKVAFDKAFVTINSLSLTDTAEASAVALIYGVGAGVLSSGVSMDEVRALINNIHAHHDTLVQAAVDQTSINDALTHARTLISRYAYAIEGLRHRAVTVGADSDFAAQLAELKSSAWNTIVATESLVNQLTTASRRNTHYQNLLNSQGGTPYLARLELFEKIEPMLEMIKDTESENNINDHRLALASYWLSFSAFPGSKIASVDIDNDGMPDFYEASAQQSDIQQSPLVLDTDSDNDGIPDAEDSTPFYCVACSR